MVHSINYIIVLVRRALLYDGFILRKAILKRRIIQHPFLATHSKFWTVQQYLNQLAPPAVCARCFSILMFLTGFDAVSSFKRVLQ